MDLKLLVMQAEANARRMERLVRANADLVAAAEGALAELRRTARDYQSEATIARLAQALRDAKDV